jgi:salicylate biosynthesis isochorismate synthase
MVGLTRETRATLGDLPLRSAAEAQARARWSGRPILASVTVQLPHRDPLDFFRRGAALAGDRFFWARPDESFAMAGVGTAWTLALDGADRFEHARAAWRALCQEAVIQAGEVPRGTGPVVLGGFSFDPLCPRTPLWDGFPDGLLLLPRYLLTTTGETSWLTVNTLVAPDAPPNTVSAGWPDEVATLLSDPSSDGAQPAPARGMPDLEDALPPEEWKRTVASVVQEIHAGHVQKVVLARQVYLRRCEPFDPAHALARLRRCYPGCFVFAVARGMRCFLGASPERLIRLERGAVQVTCLAGSIARGTTPEEDERLGTALLASEKDRAEHAFVVQALCDGLTEAGVELEPPGLPRLLKVHNVQHLFTPLRGRARERQSVLDLVAWLHPSPAVGGVPRDVALELIRERERLDRGWYAGPLGWMDRQGDGEFAVAIRSALLDGAAATLFAGCGIVAGSDPEREYAEASLKLRPMLAALGEETRD